MAVVFALATALCNAIAVVLQRSAAKTVTTHTGFSPRLVANLVRKPVWLFGLVVTIGATLFWVLAINSGELSLVQPILVIELVFIIGILWARSHSDVGSGDWIGAAAIVAGLGTFLYVANPVAGVAEPSPSAWAGAAGAALAVVIVAIVLAQRGSPACRSALYGIATAIAYAFTAAVIKTMTDVVHQGWSQVLLHWPVYVVAVVGATAFLVEQHAFQVGPLTASQPAIVIGTPLVSVPLGVWLFGDRLNDHGLAVAVEALAFLVMALGVVYVTQSSLIIETRA